MAIKPILHRIVVKQEALEAVDDHFKRARAAGIITESSEREREQAAIDSGEVVAMGPTAFKDFGADNPLKIGDKIVYARYAGKTVVDPATKEKYIALNDEDVIAVLTTEGA